MVAALRAVRRVARGVLGSDAYDRYLHHHRITGCNHPPLTERAFWRAKYAEQDANPGARCC
ncbi:YbdD/YjiX family protein [Brachybacterium sp. NBEC-018]|nr:YbdD/YjiX family protein [Brachybacterium sp. NBEC-018]